MFWHFFRDLNVYYSLQFPPWLRVLLVVRETFLMLLKSVLQVSWQWQLEQMLTRESLIPIIHCPSLPRRPSAVAEDISQQPSESQVKVPGLPVSCMGELWKLKLKVLFGKTVTVHFPRDLTSSLCCTEWIYFYLFIFLWHRTLFHFYTPKMNRAHEDMFLEGQTNLECHYHMHYHILVKKWTYCDII